VTAISYHHTINDLQGLDWSSTNPFARPEWFALLQNAGMKPVIALARDGANAVGLPLARTESGLEALTNWYAFTWSDLGTDAANRLELLEALAKGLAEQTHRIVLEKVPEEDGSLERLSFAFKQAGWIVLAQPCDTNHILRVNARSYAQFLADRPGKLRTTIKRKARKVAVDVKTAFDIADWEAYEAIYAQSWKPEEGDPRMLRKFAQGESAAGRFRFGMARHDGRPVAAQFWTVDQHIAYIHKLAHRESAKAFSPGTTLTAAMFEHVIDKDKVTLVDFGTGDDPYKRDWMEEVRTRWRLTCLRPNAPQNWPILAKSALRKLVSGKS